MAVEMNLETKTFEATGDLSTKQFYFVKFDGNVGATGCPRVVVCTAVTDTPIGVLQDKPSATGRACLVAVRGETKINADAALVVGDKIGTAADGQAAVYVPGTDTTKYIVGTVTIAAGAAGRIGSAYIDCVGAGRGA